MFLLLTLLATFAWSLWKISAERKPFPKAKLSIESARKKALDVIKATPGARITPAQGFVDSGLGQTDKLFSLFEAIEDPTNGLSLKCPNVGNEPDDGYVKLGTLRGMDIHQLRGSDIVRISATWAKDWSAEFLSIWHFFAGDGERQAQATPNWQARAGEVSDVGCAWLVVLVLPWFAHGAMHESALADLSLAAFLIAVLLGAVHMLGHTLSERLRRNRTRWFLASLGIPMMLIACVALLTLTYDKHYSVIWDRSASGLEALTGH